MFLAVPTFGQLDQNKLPSRAIKKKKKIARMCDLQGPLNLEPELTLRHSKWMDSVELMHTHFIKYKYAWTS